MRITNNGQVTIPIEIREKAGLLPGTEVEFILEEQAVKIVRVENSQKEGRGARLIRLLRGSADIKMTTDELLTMTRS